MFSSERTPLKQEEQGKAKQALDNLASSVGRDEEAGGSYLGKGPPQARAESWPSYAYKELRRNWWLWGAVAFAVLLVGGLVLFRNNLYSSAGHGLPTIAVKENAAEACKTQCNEEAALLGSGDTGGDEKKEELSDVQKKEKQEACLAKCVAEETKEVAEEREKFKESEEKLEKEEADKDAADQPKEGKRDR